VHPARSAGEMKNASAMKASTTPAPPMISGVATGACETPRAMSRMSASSTKITVTPEPIGAVVGQRLRPRLDHLFFGALALLRRHRKPGVDGGAFGDRLSHSVLTVQVDHRGLALLGDVGAQARHFAGHRR
jgi:hypothetical protein